jgi:hypothetical protein
MVVAKALVSLLQVYALLGGLVAAVFLLFGIDRVEPSARGSYAFRVLLIPGVVGLWPLVLWRWRQLEKERSA